MHLGYHYPRSIETAKQSLDGLITFLTNYKDAIVSHFPNYYMIAKWNSHVTSKEYINFIETQKQNLSIQRFKGLGEMNPEELWETTLNPDNRTLLKVQYSKGTKEKSKEDQKIINILMGDEVAPRREFITSNALDVSNLDI